MEAAIILEPAIRIINRLQRERIIERYAIGGAFGVVFYSEPILTYDLDVFLLLDPSPGRLISLAPIYERLRELGYKEKHEHILIEGIPVQFLPAFNPLLTEAVLKAREVKVGKTSTNVFRPEHLAAIMIQTGRPKDRERLLLLREQAGLDRRMLRRILLRHGLWEKWESFVAGIPGI